MCVGSAKNGFYGVIVGVWRVKVGHCRATVEVSKNAKPLILRGKTGCLSGCRGQMAKTHKNVERPTQNTKTAF